MKVLLTATPLAGHATPVLTVGHMLAQAGHEVAATLPTAFRLRAERLGIRFLPPPRASDLDMTDLNTVFPARQSLPPGLPQWRFDIETCFTGPMPGQHAAIRAALATFPADIVLADMLCPALLPLSLAPRPGRPATASLGVMPLLWRRDDEAPGFLGLPPAEAARYRAVAVETDALLLQPIQGRVDRLLATCGAGPLASPWLDAIVQLPDIFLQAAVPSFEYPRADLPASVHFIGALPPPAGHAMPPAAARALACGKRVVVVTQGTVANTDLSQLLLPALQALASRPDIVVLATTGGRPSERLPGPVPGNAVVVPFLPLDIVLPRAVALVTNGGFGTVTHALAHGVPVVAAGATEDKPEVAARLAWTGAGIDLRAGRPGAATLQRALAAVLDDASYRTRARRLATDFARFDARTETLRLLADLTARRGAPI